MRKPSYVTNDIDLGCKTSKRSWKPIIQILSSNNGLTLYGFMCLSLFPFAQQSNYQLKDFFPYWRSIGVYLVHGLTVGHDTAASYILWDGQITLQILGTGNWFHMKDFGRNIIFIELPCKLTKKLKCTVELSFNYCKTSYEGLKLFLHLCCLREAPFKTQTKTFPYCTQVLFQWKESLCESYKQCLSCKLGILFIFLHLFFIFSFQIFAYIAFVFYLNCLSCYTSNDTESSTIKKNKLKRSKI